MNQPLQDIENKFTRIPLPPRRTNLDEFSDHQFARDTKKDGTLNPFTRPPFVNENKQPIGIKRPSTAFNEDKRDV